jgi:hypothetical protein
MNPELPAEDPWGGHRCPSRGTWGTGRGWGWLERPICAEKRLCIEKQMGF